MKSVIVIPARYASTRFPGKPLHFINGVSMLERTVGAARKAGQATGARVLVATDDDRIAAHAREIGAEPVMTDPDLPSGTDRCRAAMEIAAPDADFIVNLQGDAPFTPPSHVSALIDNARWCGYVAKMTEQEAERMSDRGFDRSPIGNERRGLFVRFGVSKQNYDATPLDRWYQRHTGGVLVPVELAEVPNGKKGGGREQA